MRFLLAKCKLSETILTIALFAKNKGGGGGGGVAYFKTEGGENCSDGHQDDV